MELEEYLKVLKKNSLLIFIITVAALIIGTLYSAKTLPGYKLEQAFLIEARNPKNENAPAQAVTVEFHPSQDEARNFTDTAVALIESKDLLESLGHGAISAQKIAPQLLKITVVAKTPQEAKIQMETMVISFNQKVKELIGESELELKAIGTPPEATLDKIDSRIIFAVSLFAGLTFAVLTVSLKSYFKL